MKKYNIPQLCNIKTAIKLILSSILFFSVVVNFTKISYAENSQKNSVLIMRIFGKNNEVLDNVNIKWVDLKDGVGPNKWFKIKQKKGVYNIELPGPSVYFFYIDASGYKRIENKKIEVKKEEKFIEIFLESNSEKESDYSTFGPVASGRWYPDNKDKLINMVKSYLENVKPPKKKGEIIAVIAPHAGFEYSGQAAAYSFKSLKNQEVDRVIVLAPSHYSRFRGLSILRTDYYKTPLGLIRIDVDICDRLLEEKLINTDPYAHKKEHSLENMLPWLQLTINDFKLVPIIVGSLHMEDYKNLASVVKRCIGSKTIIVVSSDFTHYGIYFNYNPFPLNKDTRNNIEGLDKGAINKIINLDFEGYQSYVNKTEITICGRNPIGLLLNILDKNSKGELEHYYTSGDRSGNYEHSVSYTSIIFYK
jgi:MEMO1 family protein